MTVFSIALAIVLAVLMLIGCGLIGFVAGFVMFAHVKRHEIRRTLAAIKASESKTSEPPGSAWWDDWPGARSRPPGARFRPEDLRRPDGPEGPAQ
ncbi:LapA family protein [Fodinicurvata sp. EGI_FJ10296]|uniref:LapA family protein n=1 Tax=Fodinicurvata sp. EGI_FJ10296 TaxID=3231908 RepID=UPI00345207B8